MIPGQLIAQGQLTDPGVNFALVHGLTPLTVHMSFSLAQGNFKRRVTRCTTPGNPPCQSNFSHGNRTQKLPWGKSSLVKLYGETQKVYPQVKFLCITFDSQLNFKKHFEDILDRCNTRYNHLRLLAKKNGDLAHPPLSKFINNAPDQFLNTVLFRQLLPRTISSAKFSGSKTSLFGLPYVYQNTSVLSCSMTPLAFHM